jgi:hypothetical protein
MMERTGIYAQNASLILSNSSGGGRTAGQGRNAGRGNNGGVEEQAQEVLNASNVEALIMLARAQMPNGDRRIVASY